MRQKKAKLLKTNVEKLLNKDVKLDKKNKLPDGSVQSVARSTYRKAKKAYTLLSHIDKTKHEFRKTS